VHGANKARFEAAYQDIARTLRLPGFDDSKTDTLKLVCDWLSDEENGSWLMVLDNADDADVWTGPSIGELSRQDSPQQSAPLINYIPRGSHGFVLITTRDSQLGKILANAKKKPIDVLRFGPKQAEILLCRKLSEDNDINQEDTNEITEALDYLPLAITQAAAYLDQNDMTITKYLQLLRAGKADTSDLLKKGIHDPGRDYEIQNSVFQTWKMSFDQISRQDSRAAEILSLMAMLDRQAISENLLQKDGESEFEFNAAIQKLKAFSLISKETEASMFSMHRLAQLSIQKWLELEHVIEEWQEKALFVISKNCPLDGQYQNWRAWEAINPHVQIVLGYVFEKDSCLVQRASILDGEAQYHREQGRHKTAHSKALEALALCEKVLGPDHTSTLDKVHNLGLIYRDQGSLEEAEAMYERALAGREKTLGIDHTSTLNTVHYLGVLYADQSRVEEAEAMYERALAGREKALGPDHTVTLQTVNNLGILYDTQGRLEEAEVMYERALAGKEKALGLDHMSTLKTVHNLGVLYSDQGRLEEAEAMHQRALTGKENTLGLEHTSTLTTVYNLGVFYSDQGRLEEAEAMYQRALAGFKKALGLDHKSTLDTIHNLGILYRRQGRLEDAEAIFKRAETRKS
jgi:tetratricopeptide (TPR) repeat protein